RPGAHLRPPTASRRGRRAGEPRPHRSERDDTGHRERVQVALGQLVAARPRAHEPDRDDARERGGGVRVNALVLEDGTVFEGESVGAAGFACGEAVFTTAMTGYQEIATDPSFAEQLICFTAPMVGNYGVDHARSESGRVHARAVFMREA